MKKLLEKLLETIKAKKWTIIDLPNDLKCKIKIKCNNNHLIEKSCQSIIKNDNCNLCIDDTILIQSIQIVEARGGHFVENCLNGNHKWKCNFSHIFYKKPKDILLNDWCNICTTKWKSEEICRYLLEDIFNKPFIKCRPEWLRNSNGYLLELDGYCEELGIAFEHNGLQHYKDNVFSKNINTLNKIKKNDKEKLKLCNKNGVKLIIIPQLGIITKLHKLVEFLNNKFKLLNINKNIKSLNIENIQQRAFLRLDKTKYITKAKEIASQKEGECLSNFCLFANELLEWKCKRSHFWKATYSSVVNNNQWCRFCAQRIHWISKEEFIKLYFDQKLTLKEIQNITNIPPEALVKIAKFHNLELRHGFLKITKEELYKLYIEDRKSSNDIGKIFGANGATIIQHLRKNDIPLRKEFETNTITKEMLEFEYGENKTTPEELAILLNCSVKTIYKKIKLYQIKRKIKKDSVKLIVTKNELLVLYINQNRSGAEIAKIFNCSLKTVTDRLKKFGIKKKSKPIKYLNAESATEIRKFSRDGKKLGEIAKLYNVSITAISNIINNKTYKEENNKNCEQL